MENRTRTKNTKQNIIFGFMNKFVFLFFPFVIRTIIIKRLGVDYLGLNSLFASILQVLCLSELGFGSAVVFSLYKPIAEKNSELICAYMLFFRKVYRIIGAIIFMIGLAIIPFIPLLIKGNVPDGINIYILYLIYLFNTSISYFVFGYKNALLNAHQRNDIISNISSVTQIALYFFQIIVLILTNNYYLYLIIMPFCTLMNNLLTGYISHKLYPQYVCKGILDKSAIRELRNQVTGLMIHKLCLVSRNSLDSIFISAFLGLTTAAIYSNYYYIMNTIVGILSVVGNAMLASIGNSIATESQEKNYNDLKKINFIYMQIAGYCTVCLLGLYQPFMELWVGKKNMFDFGTVVLFCLYFYVLKMGDIRGTYSDAAGLWWQNRYRAILESLCNLCLNAILVYFMGINGIILATLISLFFINFIFGSQIIFKFYFTDFTCKEYFLLHSKYAFVTMAIATLCYLVNSFIHDVNIFAFLIRCLLCVIIPIPLYLVIYYKDIQFRDSISWLKKVL